MASINVSQQHALEATGPLSLLRALQLCASKSVLATIVEKAKAKKRMRLPRLLLVNLGFLGFSQKLVFSLF